MFSFLHKTETRHLHNSDMKRLVRILRKVPAPAEEDYKRKQMRYREHTKAAIRRLPSRLRCSWLSYGSTNLCSIHNGLNQNLINDMWSWIRHEFDGALGKFFYPLIMSDRLLTANQKYQVRQLEPVLQMWQSDFNVEASAPPGHEPIRCGSRWHYQRNNCPACMMARIGSHESVLFALFVGMLARFNTKTLTTMDALRSVAGWDSINSKRLRFMRYWVQKTMGYPELLRASDLGIELKRLRVQWKQEHRQLRSHSRKRTQKTSNPTSGPRCPNAIGSAQKPSIGRSAVSSASLQRSEQRATPELFDPKLGPNPRPPDVKSQSPLKGLGFRWEMPSMRRRTYTIPEDQRDIHPALRESPPSILVRAPTDTSGQSKGPSSSVESFETLRPEDSLSDVNPCPAPIPPPLRLNHRPLQSSRSMNNESSSASVPNPTSSTISRVSTKTHAPSFATTHTIASYNGGPSARANYVDPLDNPIYNYIETQEERIEKYRRLLATNPDSDPFTEYEDDATTLPTPRRQSIYSAFGGDGFDDGRFDAIDEELAEDQIEDWDKDEPDEEDEVFDEKEYR